MAYIPLYKKEGKELPEEFIPKKTEESSEGITFPEGEYIPLHKATPEHRKAIFEIIEKEKEIEAREKEIEETKIAAEKAEEMAKPLELAKEALKPENLVKAIPEGVAAFFKGGAKGAASTILNLGYRFANWLTPSSLFPKEYKEKQKQLYTNLSKKLKPKLEELPGYFYEDIAEVALATGLGRAALTKVPSISKFAARFPKSFDALSAGLTGTALGQLKSVEANADYKERLKQAAIDFPSWVAWSLTGGIPKKAFYYYLPAYFANGYLSAKLEGRNQSESIIAGLASAAMGGTLHLTEVPKSSQEILKNEAQKILDKYKIKSHSDYKKAMKIYHPDKPTGNLKIATQINTAWKIVNQSPKEVEKGVMSEFRDLWRIITKPTVPYKKSVTIPSTLEKIKPEIKPEIKPKIPKVEIPKVEVPKAEIKPLKEEKPEIPKAEVPEVKPKIPKAKVTPLEIKKKVVPPAKKIPPELESLAKLAKEYASPEKLKDSLLEDLTPTGFASIEELSNAIDKAGFKDLGEFWSVATGKPIERILKAKPKKEKPKAIIKEKEVKLPEEKPKIEKEKIEEEKPKVYYLRYFLGNLREKPGYYPDERGLAYFFKELQEHDWKLKDQFRHRFFKIENGKKRELSREEIKKHWEFAKKASWEDLKEKKTLPIEEEKIEIKPKKITQKKKEKVKSEEPVKGMFASEEQRRALWLKAPWIAKAHAHGIHWRDLTEEQQKALKEWTLAKKEGLPPEIPEPTKLNKLYAQGVKRTRERPTPPKLGLSIEAIAYQAKKQFQTPTIKKGLKIQLDGLVNKLKEILKPFEFYPDLPLSFRNAIRTKLIGGLSKVSDKVYNQIATALWGGLKEQEIAQSVELIFARDQLSRAKLGKGDPRISVEEAQKIVDKLEKEIFPEALKAANRYRIIQEEYREKLVERSLLDADQKIDDYVRHYVEDYTPDWIFRTGIPTRLRRPFRGYTKPAVGTTKAYRKDADVILGQFVQIEKDNLFEDFIKEQARIYDKKAELTREEKVKLFGVDKAGRVKSPKPGRIYIIDGKRYRAYTPDVPFTRQMYPAGEGVMALGRYKTTYLLPENIYNAFRNFSERGNYFLYLANKVTAYWKTWAITSRFVPFNINNMIGDTWMVLLQAPEPLKIFSEINTALNYMRNPQNFPEFDKFLKDNDIIGAYFIKELSYLNKSQNPIALILRKARDISGYRENILRIAYASYLYKGYLAGEGEKLVKYHNWINTEGLSTEEALGRIARDVLIDYGWVSKTFHRIIRGLLFPFSTWYTFGTRLVWKFARFKPVKFLFWALIAPVMAFLYNNRNKEIKELEQKLPDGIRDRTHIVIGENPDGTIRVWYSQLPQDVLIGTKIFSIAVNQANMVINGEKTIKEAAIDTLKRWGIKEGKGLLYLMNPMVRILRGLIDQRDPYDGLSIYSTDPKRLTPERLWWERILFIQKAFVPFLGEMIYSMTTGVKPIDLEKKEAIETFVGLRALGIIDVNKKTQIKYIDEETGEEKFLDWEDYRKILKIANQETIILSKIENDWINSGLMPDEFIKTKEFEDSILKIKKIWEKQYPEAEKLTITEIVLILNRTDRLSNILGEDITSAKRWYDVQLKRAKTDKEKRELKEKYEKIRKMKLIDSIKKLPKTAREIYLLKK